MDGRTRGVVDRQRSQQALSRAEKLLPEHQSRVGEDRLQRGETGVGAQHEDVVVAGLLAAGTWDAARPEEAHIVREVDGAHEGGDTLLSYRAVVASVLHDRQAAAQPLDHI